MNENRILAGLEPYHPLVLLAYYTVMIGTTLLCVHPVYVYCSLLGALVQAFAFSGRKALGPVLGLGLPLYMLTILLNPLLVHQGSTILFYIRYNPITWESCVFGFVFAGSLFAGVLWFYGCSRVMTGDKFLHILGGVMPTVALMTTMMFRLLPQLTGRIATIAEAQRGMGRGNTTIKNGTEIRSTAVTWALEDAVTTADSMKARGYGSRRRTRFVLFRFGQDDSRALAVVIALAAVALWGALNHGQILFYPVLEPVRWDGWAALHYGAFCLLGLLPTATVAKEYAYWKSCE